jgi:hypothetical protein
MDSECWVVGRSIRRSWADTRFWHFSILVLVLLRKDLEGLALLVLPVLAFSLSSFSFSGLDFQTNITSFEGIFTSLYSFGCTLATSMDFISYCGAFGFFLSQLSIIFFLVSAFLSNFCEMGCAEISFLCL